MVARGTGINTTVGTKYTEWVELETFSGGIALFAGDKEEGVLEAKRHIDGTSEIFF